MLEKIKSLAIVLLTVSMALLLLTSLSLGAPSGPLNALSWFMGDSGYTAATQPSAEGGTATQTAAFPAQISVLGAMGLYTAANPQEYDSMLEAVSEIYREALGSSKEEAQISREEYTTLLTAPAIHMAYTSALPLYLHHSWMPQAIGEKSDSPVSAVVIAIREGAVVLGFCDGLGGYFAMETGTNPSRLEKLCEGYPASNSVFAMQLQNAAHLRPDQVVFSGFATYPVYRPLPPAYAGGDEAPRQVLDAFSIRYYLASFFVSASGAMQYVDGSRELTVGMDGELRFTSTAEDEPVAPGAQKGSRLELEQVVEHVRSLVDAVWAVTDSFGKLSLGTVEYDSANDRYFVGFEVMIGGVYIDCGDRPAYAVVENGSLAAVVVRPFTAMQEGETSLPFLQYAAASRPDGGLIGPVYSAGEQSGLLTPSIGVFLGG